MLFSTKMLKILKHFLVIEELFFLMTKQNIRNVLKLLE